MLISYTAELHALAGLLKPWERLFNNSKFVSNGVTFLHLGGLLFAGGFAIAADRATFRALRGTPEDRVTLLREVGDVHQPVLIGLGVLFVSGVLLAASDVETFGKSVVFLVKMVLVALLMLNGLALQRTENALRARIASGSGAVSEEPMWQRLRRTAIASVTLWTAILLAGTILVNS